MARFDKTEKKLIYDLSSNEKESYAVPDGILSIGDYAFTSCRLFEIVLPDSVKEIGDSAYAGCPNIVLTVGRDSCAREYAIENEIDFTYPDALDWLNS